MFSQSDNIMKVTAPIRLWTPLLVLLVACLQQSNSLSDAAFRIVPTRLQLFEHESVSFKCEGFKASAGLRVMSNVASVCPNNIAKPREICTIDYTFPGDTGEYWCAGEGGERSNTVNITVTSGPVVLESPVLPVREGDNVTLRCRNKTSSNFAADFYRDDVLFGTSIRGDLIIHSVSKSHEGFYKCRSEAGESAVSPLTVRDDSVILNISTLPVNEGETVTLRCRNKENSIDLQADFYKDGRLISSSSSSSSSAGEFIIHSVSKSDEGVYKCSVSGDGESAETKLFVKVQTAKNGSATKGFPKEINFFFILLWIAVGVVLILQLLVIGLLYWKKQLVLVEFDMNDRTKDPPPLPRKVKKKKDAADTSDNLSFCFETNHSTKPRSENESGISSFGAAYAT